MIHLKRNIRLLYAFSFLQMTLFPMAIITLFWKDHVGLSLSQILLLQGIFAVAMVVMEYPSGYISDRIGYRTSLTWASILGIAGWGAYSLASSFREVLIAEILLGISMSFISGSDSALLYESLKGTEEEQSYAKYQGRVSGFGQTGEAAGALFAGLLYAASSILPFILQVGVWILALLLTRGLTEPARDHIHHHGHLKESLASARYVFLENRRLRATVLLNMVLGLSTFYPVWLIQPYMQKAGVPIASFGPIWAGANLMVAICAVLSHRVRVGMSEKGMILLLVALTWTGYMGLGFYGGVWGFLFYYILTAMRGMRGPFLLHVAQEQIPSATRAGMLSLQSLCFRLVFALTGPLIGRHADAHGVGETFQLLLLANVLMLPPLVYLFLRSGSDRSYY